MFLFANINMFDCLNSYNHKKVNPSRRLFFLEGCTNTMYSEKSNNKETTVNTYHALKQDLFGRDIFWA